MRRSYLTLAVLGTAALTLVACSEQAPTAPTDALAPDVSVAEKMGGPGGSKARPVSVNEVISVPMKDGTGATAGTLNAVVYLTHIALDENNNLVGTARIVGTAFTAAGSTPVDEIVTTALSINGRDGLADPVVAGQAVSAAVAQCDVLNLVLGPLHLDLLGLVVDLNQVVLDVVAESGAGNLLGNLLCAVVGLLDAAALLPSLFQFLELINNILDLLQP